MSLSYYLQCFVILWECIAVSRSLAVGPWGLLSPVSATQTLSWHCSFIFSSSAHQAIISALAAAVQLSKALHWWSAFDWYLLVSLGTSAPSHTHVRTQSLPGAVAGDADRHIVWHHHYHMHTGVWIINTPSPWPHYVMEMHMCADKYIMNNYLLIQNLISEAWNCTTN